ncbi:sensor histidine kinase [Devosia submarina]|uniref:sensor histidine kinase n=1 Tax=Devosia submarina TaxID=1173082 RepID=UPI000D34D17C|nr:HWE histidine kinase domain-containing protein [Devosia submarina]
MTQSHDRPDHSAPFEQRDFASDATLLASLFARSRDCIKVLDLEGNLLFMNEGGRRLMEVTNFEPLRHLPWARLWPEPNPGAMEALAAAQGGSIGRFSMARDSFAGNWRFWDVEVSPLVGQDGSPQRLLAISRDITEHHRAQQALHSLSSEHNHRSKNQMAVVQSIVNQTLRGTYSPDTAKKMIAARLDVLARTYDLLMHSPGERVPMRALVETGTHMLDQRRVSLEGPELVLGPKAALSLALILHELSINAATHGCFSVPHGRIEIVWRLAEMDGEPAIELVFTESGGPAVTHPATRGFGTRLVQGGLSGTASRAWLDFEPGGLRFRLLANLAGAQSDG